MDRTTNIVFLGLGTNLGDRENNLKSAISGIEDSIGVIINSSSVYETEPWGFKSDKQFLNMVVKVKTDLSPDLLLKAIHRIEKDMGRERTGSAYSPRVIDIDILFYNKDIIDLEDIQIPHPSIGTRKFVLVPLFEIEPDFKHPKSKASISTLLNSCDDQSIVVLYNNPLSAKL